LRAAIHVFLSEANNCEAWFVIGKNDIAFGYIPLGGFMAICRSCSSEVIGTDRFCRNCGIAVAPAIAELDDTRRFSPSAPLPATPPGSPDHTNPLYAPPYASYAVPKSTSPLSQTVTLVKALFKQKIVWVLLFLMVFTLVGMGIGIGRGMSRRRPVYGPDFGGPAGRGPRNGPRQTVVDPKVARQKYEEAVQNALGFKQGAYSATEFPDEQGILVNNLMSDNSPAALAKIQAGDLLTELNGKQTRNDNELSEVLDTLKTGDEVPATVYRDGEKINLRIRIADRAFPPPQTKTDQRDQGFVGILDSFRRTIPGTKKWGVEVKDLHVNSPAELFGLRPGDIITEFNGHPVKTPNEFNRHIRAEKPGSKVVITFLRGNTEQKIEMILGHRWDGLDGVMARRR
jgi:membrane-associated protease RseP (regulator of RpoE activity)